VAETEHPWEDIAGTGRQWEQATP